MEPQNHWVVVFQRSMFSFHVNFPGVYEWYSCHPFLLPKEREVRVQRSTVYIIVSPFPQTQLQIFTQKPNTGCLFCFLHTSGNPRVGKKTTIFVSASRIAGAGPESQVRTQNQPRRNRSIWGHPTWNLWAPEVGGRRSMGGYNS